MLTIDRLNKSFGQKQVLHNISIAIDQHEIVAFVGANGAGKTTLMKCMLGFLPFEGTITIAGEVVQFGETKSNAHIGYLPDVPQFYPFYTAKQYLKLCQQVSDYVSDARIDEMLALVGLADRKEKISQYSRGMKQRLGIAQALLHKPKLLICDEPTSALDPEGRSQILSILKEAKQETAILFSTHILSEAEQISDRLLILHDQEIKYDGPIARKKFTGQYEIRFAQQIDADFQAQYQLEKMGDGWKLHVQTALEKDAFLREATKRYSVEQFTPVAQTVEEFVKEVTER